jgi:hypothetical protein
MHFFNHTSQLSFNAETSDLLLCPSNNFTLLLLIIIIIIIIPFSNFVYSRTKRKQKAVQNKVKACGISTTIAEIWL